MPATDRDVRSRRSESHYGRISLPVLFLLMGAVAATCCAGELLARRTAVSSDTTPRESLPSPPPAEVDVATPQTLSDAVRQLLTRLELADRNLRETKRYAARFTQQVRKGEQLLDPEQIDLKIQHEPFAVFLQWERDGQQALFVDGAHDNKLLVHPTRGFGRLRRVWILEPDAGLAMRGALRPVTELGLLNMVDQLRGFHREHILNSHCVIEPVREGDQELTRFMLTFDAPCDNPHFAKTHLWLSDQTHLPVRIENYSWTTEDGCGPLLERYDYSDIRLDQNVTAADFDRNNAAYSF